MKQTPQILLIEDNPETAALISEVLEEEGFEVSIAENGFSALNALRVKPDIVLCDIDLPDVTGLQILASIRNRNLLPHSVPFLFVTAFAQRDYQMQARQLGCDDYITKPIDFELLIAIIRRRLSTASLRPETDIRLTDREREALTWAARGKASGEIATILNISERTVNFHIDNAMRKVGAVTRIQAAVKCALLGLIEP